MIRVSEKDIRIQATYETATYRITNTLALEASLLLGPLTSYYCDTSMSVCRYIIATNNIKVTNLAYLSRYFRRGLSNVHLIPL